MDNQDPSNVESANSSALPEGPSLVEDVLGEILAIELCERMEDRDGVCELLTLDNTCKRLLYPLVYSRIRLVGAQQVYLLARTLSSNDRLAQYVRYLSISWTCAPFSRDESYGPSPFPGGVPAVIRAVAPYVQLLIMNTSVHQDIVYAMRTRVFPNLHTMEAPYYLVMDRDWTAQFYDRLGEMARACGFLRPSNSYAAPRLDPLYIPDCWPALQRLCVQCKWGAPDVGHRPFRLHHLSTVVELAVVLYTRPWDTNLNHFLLDMTLPDSVEVVALIPSRYHRKVHELYVALSFHPKAVIPIYGEPEINVYDGNPELEYLCCLTRIVSARPGDEEFWVKLKEFVASRTMHRLVFHEGAALHIFAESADICTGTSGEAMECSALRGTVGQIKARYEEKLEAKNDIIRSLTRLIGEVNTASPRRSEMYGSE
ncbi:hypothetical protein VNI00_005512 [Paramarasmius palmivorus]|uniref:Uncharacterized protein n=1 Tax=Paramarasmius palmivorus TaxID=297713 RepID=A0AAW0DAW5_9AGAR